VSRPKGNRKAAAEVINDHVVSMIENLGEIPWRNPIVNQGHGMQRGVDGHIYQGSNLWITLITAFSKGYEDPRWLTFDKAKDLGGTVRKGESSTPVCWWFTYKKDTGETDDDGEPILKGSMGLKVWRLFNVEQTDGCDLPPLPTRVDPPEWAASDYERAEAARRLVMDWPGRPKIETGGGRAYYMPSTDTIRVPKQDNVTSGAEWAGMLLHEGVHATGHESRLKRKGIADGLLAPFGSEVYSREELVAELGCAYLAGMTGIATPQSNRNSAAYLKGWLSALKQDPKALIMASAQAMKAVDLITAHTKKGES
jgi:antirestriction protein ArdC